MATRLGREDSLPSFFSNSLCPIPCVPQQPTPVPHSLQFFIIISWGQNMSLQLVCKTLQGGGLVTYISVLPSSQDGGAPKLVTKSLLLSALLVTPQAGISCRDDRSSCSSPLPLPTIHPSLHVAAQVTF